MHTFGIPTKSVIACFGLLSVVALILPMSLDAQQVVIEGTITDSETGNPLIGANVLIQGTTIGAATDEEGRYRIPVPAARVTGDEAIIIARFIGYRAGTQSIMLSAGIHTANFSLRPDFFGLDEIIVTGVLGATERTRLPFTVGRLNIEDLQVTSHISAANLIQGKIAGATVVQGSGRPGSPPSFLLRGPTAIDAGGRSQEPLYILDGAPMTASFVDINALDIESIEVVKGAAASSLYGARAANGVIQITTRRGHSQPDNTVRYTVKTDYGVSELAGTIDLTQRHEYRMNPDGTQFIGADGNPCDWLDCLTGNRPQLAGQYLDPNSSNPAFQARNEWTTVQENAWPTTYDQVKTFFDPGTTVQNYISAEGRSGRTNFHTSLSHTKEEGVMTGLEGFQRFAFRLNVDQAVMPNLIASGSATVSRSTDDLFPESQGTPLFTLTRTPAGVDLMAHYRWLLEQQEAGVPMTTLHNYIRPDPHKENANPLYEVLTREYERIRSRMLGNFNLRYTPTDWMLIESSVSYDRFSQEDADYFPIGFITARAASTNTGHVWKYSNASEALNASLATTFTHQIGRVNNRIQARYLWWENQFRYHSGWGYDLGVSGVPSLHATGGTVHNVRSQQEQIKHSAYSFIYSVDFDGRYIGDFLVRRDGSSLFGSDERWQNYYRTAFAWRITEEPWFNIRGLDELKARYSFGTAGGLPSFVAQYETYSVLRGILSPVTLGNTNLKPEEAAESEVGLEVGFLDRFSLELVYADTEVKQQILQVPLLGYTGFVTQWQNAGTLRSNTWEATLSTQLMRTRDFNWTARLTFDRTRQMITELHVADYTYGVSGQELDVAFYARPGERLGTFYGFKWATDCSQLPGLDAAACEANFQINDDGYLVPVGEGNTWREGFSNQLWGSTVTVDGVTYTWGLPVHAFEPDRRTGELTNFLPLGNTTPDYRIAFSMNMNYKNLGVYFLLDAEQGFDILNQARQWATFEGYSGIMDQSGKPEERKKPMGYYARLYNSLAPTNTQWVEDGSYIKLRELALTYRISRRQLASIGLGTTIQGITFRASGRNLITWTDYTGYDPEVGRSGGDVGSSAIARVDGYNYPNYRVYTFGFELNF
jgi:TonB-linked SusC/RagA family outer membrane protein